MFWDIFLKLRILWLIFITRIFLIDILVPFLKHIFFWLFF